jgi:hypothetical protein
MHDSQSITSSNNNKTHWQLFCCTVKRHLKALNFDVIRLGHWRALARW